MAHDMTRRTEMYTALSLVIGEQPTAMLLDYLPPPGWTGHIEARIDALESGMTTRMDRTDERFDRIDLRFDKVDERFDRMEAKFDKIDERFEKMEAKFDKIDERFEKMEAKFDAKFEKIDERFEKLEAKFEKIDERFEKLEAKFDAKYDVLIARMEQGFASMRTDMHSTRLAMIMIGSSCVFTAATVILSALR